MAWYYIKKGMLDDETVGPLTDDQMRVLFLEKKIDGKTMVAHAQTTSGQWITLGSSALNRPLMAALHEQKRQNEQQALAERQRKQSEKEAERLQREEQKANREQERQSKFAELERAIAVEDSQKRVQEARVGADRWPNMFRCASVYEVAAIFAACLFAVLVCSAGIWPLFIGFGTLLAAVATGSPMGILFGAGIALLGLIEIVTGGLAAFLIYISMRSIGESLRCFAAIEANTRTMWNFQQPRPPQA